jgi:uncharacterized repeat protein (TIGR03943 family)
MSIDAKRVRLAVLLSWAAFFVVLWATGTSVRYLGTRTQWVVPFGALTLVAASVIAWRTPSRRTPLSLGEGVGLAILLIPLAGVLLMPHAQLGAYAASRKTTNFFPAAKPKPPATPRDVSLLDIRVADAEPSFAVVSHIGDGLRVRLRGIVLHRRAGAFDLGRFLITCCLADASPIWVPVAWAGPVKSGGWVDVTGTLRKRGGHLVIAGDRVAPTHAPSDPYLTFAAE